MRSRLTFLSLLFPLVLVPAAGFSQQNNNVALIIGDAAYPDAESPLKEPLTDAHALRDELKRRGFDVDVGENLKKEAMQHALERFYGKIKPNSTALIFFSGFGIQSDRQSYMLPVDAQIWNEGDVRRDGFSLDKALAEMTGKGAGVKIAIVDASRRNPFERRFRSVSAGLAAITASKGSVVMSSAPPDTVVRDGSPPVFVTELIKELKAPGATIEQIFNRTRIDVSRATQGQQVPWFSSSLEEDVAFGSQSAPGTAAVAQKSNAQPATTTAKSEEQPATPAPPNAPSAKNTAKSEERPATSAPANPPNTKTTAKSGERPAAPPATNTQNTKTAPKTDERPTTPATTAQKTDTQNAKAATKPAETKTAATSNEAPAPPAAKAAVSSPDPEAEARHDYVVAEGLGTKQAWDDFISKHNSGYYYDRAREKMAKLSPDDNPKDMAGFYRRGQRYAVDGEFTKAIEDFDEVIRRDPKHAGALNNRCWVRTIIGDFGAALKDCDEALRIAPNYMDALDSRGMAELKIGRLKESIADYDAALRIDPKHASSLYGRGIAELRSGDAAGGKRDVDDAKKLKSTIADEFAGYGIR